MANDSNTNRQDERQQGTGQSGTSRSAQDQDRSDRERSIETGRERTRQTPSVGRPQSISPSYGSGTGAFSLMRRMADDMDRLFQEIGMGRGFGLASAFDRDFWRGGSAVEAATWAPQLDAFRRGDKYVIRADLPGLKKDDVKVEVHDGTLTITGERRSEHDETKDDVYRSERSYGRFFRAVSLPENVSAEDCEATFKDGVLEVTFSAPRQQTQKSKQVPIR
jgi:HSP20 family protein